jgi:hypothetical protein
MHNYKVILEGDIELTVLSSETKSQVAKSVEFERLLGKVIFIELVIPPD